MVRLLRYDFCIVPWAGMKWVDTLWKDHEEFFPDIYGRKQLLRDVHLHTTMPINGIHFDFSSSYDIRGLKQSLSVWKGII